VALLKVRKGKIGRAAGREQNVQGGEQISKLNTILNLIHSICLIQRLKTIPRTIKVIKYFLICLAISCFYWWILHSSMNFYYRICPSFHFKNTLP